MEDKQNKSSHILNASSNLLGICFVVLTSLKLLNIGHKTIIDDLTALAILFFMTSCVLSFLSIRGTIRESSRIEDIADLFFIAGLLLLFATAVLFSLNIIE